MLQLERYDAGETASIHFLTRHRAADKEGPGFEDFASGEILAP
jgi:hypothetical protein